MYNCEKCGKKIGKVGGLMTTGGYYATDQGGLVRLEWAEVGGVRTIRVIEGSGICEGCFNADE